MKKRRGDSDFGFLISILFIFAAFMFGFVWGNNVGHEYGVRDGLSGKYVIDTLSDGTTVVTKVTNKVTQSDNK